MTDYHAIGGAEAVRQVMDRFYELVHADDQFGPYFAEVDLMHLRRHQARLLTRIRGEPVSYAGRTLRVAQQGLSIARAHGRLRTYLAGALWESGAGVDVLMRLSGVLAELESEVVDGAAATGEATAPPGHSTEPSSPVQAPQHNGHGVLPPRGLHERS